MYNGNGKWNNRNGYTTVGGFRIKSVYLYVAVGIVALLAIYTLTRFLNTSLVVHFGMVAGALLILANLRELLGQTYSQHSSTALLNCLIGVALVCAWLSQIFSMLMWVPAVALLAIAAPLAIGRAGVYSSYMRTARTAFDGVRRTMGRYN